MTQAVTELERENERIRAADRFGAFVAVGVDAVPGGAGTLSGMRVAVKDNIAVAGLPFTAGHDLFAARVASDSATAVQRLRAAGARVVGVTRTDAGGFGVTTPGVDNPLLPGHSAGGSSGGAAAAVAAGLADIGLGTDTGGSVRIPAACCGLFGFKPSQGAVPADGVWPMAPALEQVGLMCRSFDLLLRASASLLAQPLSGAPAAPVLGVDFDRIDACEEPVRSGFRGVVAMLEKAGVRIMPVSLPPREATIAAHGILALAEAREVYAACAPGDLSRLGVAARSALAWGAQLGPETVMNARSQARQIVAGFKDLFDTVDAILTPTIPIPVPRHGVRTVMLAGQAVPPVTALVAETCLANLAGTPALAMPLASAAAAAPVSVQLLAPHGQDSLLFQFAAALLALQDGPGRTTLQQKTEQTS